MMNWWIYAWHPSLSDKALWSDWLYMSIHYFDFVWCQRISCLFGVVQKLNSYGLGESGHILKIHEIPHHCGRGPARIWWRRAWWVWFWRLPKCPVMWILEVRQVGSRDDCCLLSTYVTSLFLEWSLLDKLTYTGITTTSHFDRSGAVELSQECPTSGFGTFESAHMFSLHMYE